MLLIADSGSTKTDWALLSDNNSEISLFSTSGINPYYLEENEIVSLLEKEFPKLCGSIDKIFFYGAGCTPMKKIHIYNVLKSFFNARCIEVHSDLYGAAIALGQKEECIVSILGTGSNSCHFDGVDIIYNVSPLGYILGDEGSGASLGKKLIADILKKQINEEIINDFYSSYQITQEEIMINVYHKPFPNRFLAQFTPFILKHSSDKQISRIIETCFDEFFTRNIAQYKAYTELPLHFTGSIAYYFQEKLRQFIEKHGLILGRITKTPLKGLIEFHKEKESNG
ncbi:ATPase [Bacteroidales bacterium OttesenSCG-928-M11]|nr:ATPase [Bacteroidales bacterium OttesenSCG-928-M11]